MSRMTGDCFQPGDGLMSHQAALELIAERAPLLAGTETVSLGAAVGRIAAVEVRSSIAVPLTANAAVDGYAFRHREAAASGFLLPVAGALRAGPMGAMSAPDGAALRIYTGAAVPAGLDCIAMEEDCREDSDGAGVRRVHLPATLKAGANLRQAGEDVEAGDMIIAAGRRLSPADIGALASIGLADVVVRRRLVVGVYSSGDEVVRPGRPIVPGEVYDANHALVSAVLRKAGAEVVDLGVLPDDLGAVTRGLTAAAGRVDLVITSGGASRGAADHMVAALEAIGRRHLWRIAVKPGKPLALGQIGNAAYLGLPGNPVAAFASLTLYGLPLIAALEGAQYRPPPRYLVPAAFSVSGRSIGRREFLRGILTTGGDGIMRVQRFPRDGSGLISSLRAADGFIELAEEVSEVVAGSPVPFIPFASFFE